jgi:secreted effector OspC
MLCFSGVNRKFIHFLSICEGFCLMISPIGTSNVAPIPQVATASAPSQTTIGSEVLHVGSAISRPVPSIEGTENVAINLITESGRAAVATEAYATMLAHEANLQVGGAPSNEVVGDPLSRLEARSEKNLNMIRERLGPLTYDEKLLVRKIIEQGWNYCYETNANLDDGQTLKIVSPHAQSRNEGATELDPSTGNRRLPDIQDFVSLSVQLSGSGKSETPVNSESLNDKKPRCAYVYVISECLSSFEFGHLTLTKPVGGHSWRGSGLEWGTYSYLSERALLDRTDPDRVEPGYPQLFSTKDMKEAVALSTIDFYRDSKASAAKGFDLNNALNTSEELERGVKQVLITSDAEFSVPRTLVTADYRKQVLRQMTLEEAVKAGNIGELSDQVKDKRTAVSAMMFAIASGKEDVVNYLLVDNKWGFSRPDFHDVGYVLVGPGTKNSILDKFLSAGLVDVNKKFEGTNEGETMLNRAIAAKDTVQIELLKSHGARLESAEPDLLDKERD